MANSTRSERHGITHNVRVLSWVSFFADASSEMLYPVFPIFVTQTLGASAAVLGFIEGVAEGTASIGMAVSGRLADRIRRRRRMIALGYGISALAKPVIGLARTWPLALVGRFIDRAGKGLRDSPRDAVLAGESTQQVRGRTFGYQRGADTAGAVVGPLVGLGLYEALGHQIRPLFFIAVIPGAVSVALVRLVREPKTSPGPPKRDRALGQRRIGAASVKLLPARYWQIMAVLALFNLVNFSDSLMLLRAKEVGLAFASVILVYALFNASYAALSLPAGTMSDRLPRRIIYAIGLLVFAVSYIGLGLTRSTIWVWVLFAIYGGYWALTDGVSRAWVADLVPPELAGTGLGFYQGLIGVCVLIAGVWAGLAWGADGRWPLIVSGVIAGTLAIGLLTAGRALDQPRP